MTSVVIIGCGTVTAIYLRRHVVPPDCRDPRTLALVRAKLVSEFKLPSNVRIELIHTLAGGYLAFRFVCEGSIAGVEPSQLPPGPKPGFVHYTTELSDSGRQLDVGVRVTPLLFLEPVE